MSRPLRVAVAQYAPSVTDLDHNVERGIAVVEEALGRGADLIVLPELASSGYTFESAAEVDAALADHRLDDAIAARLRRGAAHVVMGRPLADGEHRYNGALVLGPGGVVATYAKIHPFHNEQDWFEPGGCLTLAELPWGRVGVLICFDLWFPEAARALCLAGADVIAVPTNWVGQADLDPCGLRQGAVLAMATAAQNGVVMACSDRTGTERGVTFLGGSLIVGADGWAAAGPAPFDADALLITDIDLDDGPRARQRTPRSHLVEQRRPQAYDAVVPVVEAVR